MTSDLQIIQTVGTLAESSGGPARTIRHLAEALGRAGARVAVVAGHDAARDGALLLPDTTLATVRLVPVSRKRFGFADLHTPIAALAARSPGRTIIHDNGLWSFDHLQIAHAARRLRLPLVISPHGMLDSWALAFHGHRKRLARALYQDRLLARANGLVATAPSERDSIRALFAAPPLAVIANGVPCAPTPPDRSQRSTATDRVVLFMSRIHPKKNLFGLVEAWREIARDPDFADWTLVIAGPDESGHAAEIAAYIAQLGLNQRIRLEGPVAEDDKAAKFAAADIFILPTFSENFGIVVAEALAAGVPAIATTGAPWAGLEKQRCGLYVDPDPESLARALVTLMVLSHADRVAMGRRGHAYVRSAFGWEGIAGQMLAFYQSIMSVEAHAKSNLEQCS